jgi:S-adenosyl methyltransferase
VTGRCVDDRGTGGRTGRLPEEIGLDRPNAARMYDYYLGGAHNFAVDREMADQAIAAWPELPQIMRANRAFLRRAVRFLVDRGVRQFLDLGSGIPTAGNVHDVALSADPSCRVVYVDVDEVAVLQARALLSDHAQVTAVQADLRDPGSVLAHPEVRGQLDLTRPVAVMMVAVLHFVADSDDPAGIVAGYRDRIAEGSYLAICHASDDAQPERAAEHRAVYARTPTPMTMRSRDQVEALFAGFQLVEPGVVYMATWRPDDVEEVPERPALYPGYAGVARKH